MKKVVGTVTTVFVYNVAGQLIAEYTSDPVPPAAGGGGTSYLTADHLGSTRVVTDRNGNVVSRHDYLPFGEELPSTVGGRSGILGYGASDSTRQKFTSKERDDESKLDYFGARYFSSSQGRFTGVDPANAGARISDPQSWNGFAYTLNNPLRYMDPDGKQIIMTPDTAGKIKDFFERAGNWLDGWGWRTNAEVERYQQALEDKWRNWLRGLQKGAPLIWHDTRDGSYVEVDPDKLSREGVFHYAALFKWAIENGKFEYISKEEGERLLDQPIVLSSAKSVDDILQGAAKGKSSSSRQFSKSGGLSQANKDFDDLAPNNVQSRPGGVRIGDLSDGSKAVVRPNSSTGNPTLEIQPPKGQGRPIKVRYQ